MATSSRCNIRMLYDYFNNKEGIYLAVLEHVYAELWIKVEKLDLLYLDPDKGVVTLFEFTLDHMLEHQKFTEMIEIEYIQQDKFLRRSETV